jgi:Uncharacterised protein family (UPF0236)
LKKITYAGTQLTSFAKGTAALAELSGLNIAPKQVERISEKIGNERVEQRDQKVRQFVELPLMDQCKSPVPNPPSETNVATVMADGGRLQILDRSQRDPDPNQTETASESDNPSESDNQPNYSGHWREDKIGLVMTMTSTVSADDPCPEIPEHFIDPLRIFKLAREIKGHVPASKNEPDETPESAPAATNDAQEDKPSTTPKPKLRTMVATRGDAEQFGEILAQAAWSRGFAAAGRKAFVGDGAKAIWAIHKRWFSDYMAILDFIHALTYVFAAAMAGRKYRQGWDAYKSWIQQVWSGRVEAVIAALQIRLSDLGEPKEDEADTSPRKVVSEALTYLRNNAERMRYDKYRKAGMPITSSHMESTVKMFNYRLKGTEKFWSEKGAEAMLQLRADHLSETEPLEAFWEKRQETATGRRPYRRVG